MDRGARQATVPGVAKSRTRLSTHILMTLRFAHSVITSEPGLLGDLISHSVQLKKRAPKEGHVGVFWRPWPEGTHCTTWLRGPGTTLAEFTDLLY